MNSGTGAAYAVSRLGCLLDDHFDPDGNLDQLSDQFGTSVAISNDGTTAMIPGPQRELGHRRGLCIPRLGRGIVGVVFDSDGHLTYSGLNWPLRLVDSTLGRRDHGGHWSSLPRLGRRCGLRVQRLSEGSWATTSTPTAILTNSALTQPAEFGSSVALSADGTPS